MRRAAEGGTDWLRWINSLEVITEQIPIPTQIPEPDPNWRAIDGFGHGHFAEQPDGEKTNYPTLEWAVTVPAVGDHPELGVWECRICGETVEPATHTPDPNLTIPGDTTYLLTIHHPPTEGSGSRLTHYRFGPQTAADLERQLRETAQRVLFPFKVRTL